MDSRLAITLEGLCFAYGVNEVVLRDLSLTTSAIGRTAIMGPSGVGKSTLLKLVTGVLLPTGGTVGLSAADGPSSIPMRTRFSYVSQDDSSLPWLTVARSIDLASRLVSGHPKTRLALRQSKVLEELGLTERLGSLPKELSGGMRRRAALAAALLAGADLLVLDEPFAGSDILKRASMYKAIKDTTESDSSSLLFTTHDAVDAIELATQVFWLGGPGSDRMAILDAREGWTLELKSSLTSLMMGYPNRA